MEMFLFKSDNKEKAEVRHEYCFSALNIKYECEEGAWFVLFDDPRRDHFVLNSHYQDGSDSIIFKYRCYGGISRGSVMVIA